MSQCNKQQPDNEWYESGISFSCTQCGHCCTGPTGFVWFADDELTAMADYFNITPNQFIRRHARKIHGRLSLNERKVNGLYDCVFLQRDPHGKALCAIYPVRPTQCGTWPFWPENLRSPEAWESAGRNCPGMANSDNGEGEGEGQFYPIEEIRIRRDSTNE